MGLDHCSGHEHHDAWLSCMAVLSGRQPAVHLREFGPQVRQSRIRLPWPSHERQPHH